MERKLGSQKDKRDKTKLEGESKTIQEKTSQITTEKDEVSSTLLQLCKEKENLEYKNRDQLQNANIENDEDQK